MSDFVSGQNIEQKIGHVFMSNFISDLISDIRFVVQWQISCPIDVQCKI